MVNKELIRKDIEKISNAKYKYFFIGIIVSLIPYSIILLIINNYSYGSNNLRDMVILFGIITTIINAFGLSKMAYDKLIDYFNLKYGISYKEAKNELI
jgi:Na+/H+ antiporter NhaC